MSKLAYETQRDVTFACVAFGFACWQVSLAFAEPTGDTDMNLYHTTSLIKARLG